MRLKHRTPCNECPWRRASPPGFMGGHDPADYAQLARFQAPTACHKTVTADPDHEPSLCAGMAQHLNNSCSSPRDKAYAAEVERAGTSPDVFMWTSEFTTHHAQDFAEFAAAKLKGNA